MPPNGRVKSAGVAFLERKAHEDFINLRSDAVYGRDGILRCVNSYVTRDEHNIALAFRGATGVVDAALKISIVCRVLASLLAEVQHPILVLEGEAGAGKSAIVARSVARVQSCAPHLKVFYHFVGAAPGSTDLVRLLRRLWLELAPDQSMPPTEDGLVRNATDLLTHAGREGGVAIFIDALNQLDVDAERAQLRWLPALLPPGVRCVVSVIGGTPSHQLLCDRTPRCIHVPVGPLDNDACRQVVFSVMNRDGNEYGLACSELEQLLSKQGARNALWLVSACEELKLVAQGSLSSQLEPAAITAKIVSFADDLLGLLQQILTRVEAQQNETLVVAALCLLECSRHGLSESELLALLADERKCRFSSDGDCACVSLVAGNSIDGLAGDLKGQLHTAAVTAVQDKTLEATAPGHQDPSQNLSAQIKSSSTQQIADKMLSTEKWAPILASLKPFLRPCGGVGQDHLDFFHRAVSKAVRKAYLPDKEHYIFWHGRLADFFEKCSDPQRRAEELPYHLEKILDNSRLLRSLVQWDVFESLAIVGHGFELLRYCRVVGGYSVLASAITEQVKMWTSSEQCGVEELMNRKCIVAEFLIKAGQFSYAIRLLSEEGTHALPPAMHARCLCILADAMLGADCFAQNGASDQHDARHVINILERGVALWNTVADTEKDEVAMAQALSNLCFVYQRTGQIGKAVHAGRDSIEIFSRMNHPRLAQAQQHLAHVFDETGALQGALDMYKQSILTFQIMGADKFDTEYACSLSCAALLLFKMNRADPPWPKILAYARVAVVSCESITGQDHAEASYYRELLANMLAEHDDDDEAAEEVQDGAHIVLTEADWLAIRDDIRDDN